MMFELFLSKTPNKEASPATARQARHTTEKYSLLFSFCAPPISFSSNEKSIFLWCSAFQVFRQVAGLSAFCIRSGVAEFPPNPPSATPSLPTAIFLADFSYKTKLPNNLIPICLTNCCLRLAYYLILFGACQKIGKNICRVGGINNSCKQRIALSFCQFIECVPNIIPKTIFIF